MWLSIFQNLLESGVYFLIMIWNIFPATSILLQQDISPTLIQFIKNWQLQCILDILWRHWFMSQQYNIFTRFDLKCLSQKKKLRKLLWRSIVRSQMKYPILTIRRRRSIGGFYAVFVRQAGFSPHVRHRTANAVHALVHPGPVYRGTHPPRRSVEVHVRGVDGGAVPVGWAWAGLSQAADSHGGASARFTQTAVGHVWVRTCLLQRAGAVAAVAQTAPHERSPRLDAQGAQYVGVVPGCEYELWRLFVGSRM